jgi:hypothetical protein
MLDKGSCLCVLGVGVGVVGASGNGLSCLVLSFPEVKDLPALPLPAKSMALREGGRSESQPMRKTGYGVKANPKTGVRTGAGAFSVSVVKENGGTGLGLDEAGVLTVLLCVSFGSRTTANYVAW